MVHLNPGQVSAGPRKTHPPSTQALNVIPVLLRIPGLADKVFSGQKAFMTELDKLVAEHRRTRDPAQPPRDLTDAYLDEVEKVRRSCQGKLMAG